MLGLLCSSKVGGEPCPWLGAGLILPAGERRESPEVPGFSFAPLKVIHSNLWLFASYFLLPRGV